MLKVVFTISLACILFTVRSQERCGTVAYEKLRALHNPKLETIDQFELWMKDKLTKKSQTFQAERTTGASYQIPVVIHVIHNGEAVGSGTNISDAQVLSQITVLNNDFQRLNADAINTPTEFVPVAGAFPVTFVLAKQDPNGLATTGIVRVKGSQTSWDISDNYTLKALSYWPAENYLNIWVTNLTGGLLGYTQLPASPTSPPLLGLDDSSIDRITDGVVIDYSAFGVGSGFNLQAKYDLGRTATHEVGHFFGLRHVWGDVTNGSCDPTTNTDYVSDTPIQNTDYNGTCPSGTQTECSVHSMYGNYLNYTDDACMNIFSVGQVARMDVIINNSPRRVSLLTSPGLQAPSPVANDLGIKSISNPGATTCSGSLAPSILIRNYGTNTITNAQVQFFLNGSSVETKIFSSLNLAPNTETTIGFSSVTLNEGAAYNFTFQIVQTNGGTDGNSNNNSQLISTKTPVSASLPLFEQFNTISSGNPPAGWQVSNPDGLTTWSSSSSNHWMYMDFYDYDNSGASDLLVTPVLDLTTAAVGSLNFDYAYAQYQGGSTDRLRVLVSTVCNFNASPVEVFNKSGASLATAAATANLFTPTSAQWATSIISLNQFLGQKIQIAFVGVNGYGNNLYLDNVTITNTPIILNGLVSPSPVSCNSMVTPVISVTNIGNTTINSLTANVYVNDQLTVNHISGIQLNTGATANVTLPAVSFVLGTNTLSIAIKNPNGAASSSTASDSLQTSLVINSATDIVPLRENFDDNFAGKWTAMNPKSGINWLSAETNKSNSMLFPAFGNADIGQQAWLVSPVIDFSTVETASINFESSYAYNGTGIETLQVFSSSDCGVTFDSLLFNVSGATLSNSGSRSAWTPAADSEWKKNYINLKSLVGKQNIRLVFVATNGGGNNLYLDNIIITNSPIIIKGLVSPSPVSCNSTVTPVISMTNIGNTTINSFTANVYVNNQLIVEQISGIELGVDYTADFKLAPTNFLSGSNTLSIAIKNPNGVAYPSSPNDSLQTSLVINSASDIAPLRENFDNNFEDRWSTVNPKAGIDWLSAKTNKSNSMSFPAFENVGVGQQAWLVSPVIDFSKAQMASVNFETSYAYDFSGIETLQVFSSSDCGVTFDTLLFNSSGATMANSNEGSAWTPSADSDWTKNYINLNSVAGKENVRLAFVATNGNGNNLYIDNIEFFMDDLQSHNSIDGLYSVYYGEDGTVVKVTFNLPERELVRMQVYDILGHVVSDNLLPDTLNQTYTIDYPQAARGLYVVRVQTATSLGSTKVLMGF